MAILKGFRKVRAEALYDGVLVSSVAVDTNLNLHLFGKSGLLGPPSLIKIISRNDYCDISLDKNVKDACWVWDNVE